MLRQEAIDKLYYRVIKIAEQMVVDALKTCDLDHSKVNIKGALRSDLNGLLVSILDDLSGIREFFDDVIIQAATTSKLLPIIVSTILRETATMALITPYAAKIGKQEVEKSVRDLVLNQPPPLLPGSDS